MLIERLIALTMALMMVSGCATMRDSLLVGMGSGVATGATLGAVTRSENKGQGALIGGAIGAGIGMIAAFFTHKGLENRDAHIRRDTLFSLEKFGVSEVPSQNSSVPAVSFPVVEEQKVETHRQGNKVIEAHRIWILSDDSNVHYSQPGASQKDKK